MTTPKIVYNEHERHTLVELVMQHRSVIDSRRVDADTLSKKRLTWLKITNEYNRQPRVRKRLTKQLRRLWENTKARAKKGFAPSGQSVAHELLNESVDEPTMETIHTEDNPNADLTSGCDEVYVIPNGCATRIHASKSSRVHPKKTRNRLERNAEANGVFDNSAADIEMEEQAPNVDDILAPIIAARVRRNDEAIGQQRELHQLAVQRERLQIRALEEQTARQAEQNAAKSDRERELHELRIRHEQELHMQRMQNEQEIHQIRLSEYNKMQLASYPNAIV